MFGSGDTRGRGDPYGGTWASRAVCIGMGRPDPPPRRDALPYSPTHPASRSRSTRSAFPICASTVFTEMPSVVAISA